MLGMDDNRCVSYTFCIKDGIDDRGYHAIFGIKAGINDKEYSFVPNVMVRGKVYCVSDEAMYA